jgi:hypothetical protein
VVNENITAGTININNTYKMETNTKTALNINIGNIVSMVDSNITYTTEEKSQVKDTLTKITNLISATGSTAVKVTYHFWLHTPIAHFKFLNANSLFFNILLF